MEYLFYKLRCISLPVQIFFWSFSAWTLSACFSFFFYFLAPAESRKDLEPSAEVLILFCLYKAHSPILSPGIKQKNILEELFFFLLIDEMPILLMCFHGWVYGKITTYSMLHNCFPFLESNSFGLSLPSKIFRISP